MDLDKSKLMVLVYVFINIRYYDEIQRSTLNSKIELIKNIGLHFNVVFFCNKKMH